MYPHWAAISCMLKSDVATKSDALVSLIWYVAALADILDYIPKEHEKRQKLIAIEKELLETLVKYQDKSGRWYEVVDKGYMKLINSYKYLLSQIQGVL